MDNAALTAALTAALVAALETLLPGNDRFPSARAVGIADRLLTLQHLRPAVETALTRLPSDIATLSAGDKTATLQAWESNDPESFGAFLVAAYSAYYTHPTVLNAVQSATVYAARPPQPEGYALEPFDHTIVAVPRRHRKRWRDA